MMGRVLIEMREGAVSDPPGGRRMGRAPRKKMLISLAI